MLDAWRVHRSIQRSNPSHAAKSRADLNDKSGLQCLRKCPIHSVNFVARRVRIAPPNVLAVPTKNLVCIENIEVDRLHC